MSSIETNIKLFLQDVTFFNRRVKNFAKRLLPRPWARSNGSGARGPGRIATNAWENLEVTSDNQINPISIKQFCNINLKCFNVNQIQAKWIKNGEKSKL